MDQTEIRHRVLQNKLHMYSELWEVMFCTTAHYFMPVFRPLIKHPAAYCQCERSNLFQIHKCNCIGPDTHGREGWILMGLIYDTLRGQAMDPVFRRHLIHPPSCQLQKPSLVWSSELSLHSITRTSRSLIKKLLECFLRNTNPHKPSDYYVVFIHLMCKSIRLDWFLSQLLFPDISSPF